MIRSRQLLATAGAALLLSTIAACTALPSAGSTSTPISSATAPVPSDDRTYTKANLGTILGTVNTSLRLSGTVSTQDGPQTTALDALSAAIAGSDASFAPGACASLVTSDVQLGTQGVVAGTLTSSKLNLIASTITGAALPSSLMGGFTSTQSAILSTCRHVTISATVDGQTVSVTVDFVSLPVTTNASQSIAFRESSTIAGGGGASTSTRTVIEASYGNLVLLASGVTVTDTGPLEEAINAAVAAAGS
jgi:hypothetical protein